MKNVTQKITIKLRLRKQPPTQPMRLQTIGHNNLLKICVPLYCMSDATQSVFAIIAAPHMQSLQCWDSS